MRYGFCPILDNSKNISSGVAQAVARERWITKSRGDVEIIVAETRRLEALGIVLGMLRLHEPKRGTTAMYETEADRQRAYRKRKSESKSRTVESARQGMLQGREFIEVACYEIGQKLSN